MTNSIRKMKKGKDRDGLVGELKLAILRGEIQIKDIFDALNDKDQRKVARKIKKSEDFNQKGKKDKICAPTPSGAISETESCEHSDRRDDCDICDSRSDPFPDSEDEIRDVLNEGINPEDLNGSRRRDYSLDDYATNRSIVTRENQNIERRVDPFNDKGKMIGKITKKGNPPSRAPIQMRKADPLELYSETVALEMNQKSYDEKAKIRKASLLKMGLTKEKLEPKNATIDDLNMRQKLKLEKERFEIDAVRRTLKTEEPNVVNTSNGEWSDEWRSWFEMRFEQCESWLLEDASIYSHLPPSKECDLPRGYEHPAADWNVFRKSETQVPWDYEKYGPMMLTENLAYDGNKLYDPLTGKSWSNIIEVLESEVKRKYQLAHPNATMDVFEKNDGFFWSTILQQWYDGINVSHQSKVMNTKNIICGEVSNDGVRVIYGCLEVGVDVMVVMVVGSIG